ncbi:MAG: hypothetical protein A2Y62_15825 [Candidatus Fischerbacteria bacterium RBG_13_37_8]|uniref:RDD domain-containing protein n=1 Tax=Candidatus Fischerbacteria bacterium RBG_13_37_8 TaxID=1817863 RepID=A0A1F5VVQ0_9BACT|nr:MAG: hypothetical protein A2Y62_15825 [Candidatus Fischerbacteria bacterium RBG_13_37_8]
MKAFKKQPAGFWIRLLAYFIDGAILSIIMGIIGGITIGLFILLKWNDIKTDPAALQSPLFLLLTTLCTLLCSAISIYYILSGPAKKGATPGKRILGLKIYTVDGQSPIGWKIAFMRLLGYLVSGFILYIGFLMIAFRTDKRGLHDLIAKTIVVKEKS